MAELKPCPFCGGKKLSVFGCYEEYYVSCSGCFTEGPSSDSYEEAIEAWNRRAENA